VESIGRHDSEFHYLYFETNSIKISVLFKLFCKFVYTEDYAFEYNYFFVYFLFVSELKEHLVNTVMNLVM
jgi:hypothetical protein